MKLEPTPLYKPVDDVKRNGHCGEHEHPRKSKRSGGQKDDRQRREPAQVHGHLAAHLNSPVN